MTQLTLEELRKTVELLKDVETLQDAGIRKQMQQLILATTTNGTQDSKTTVIDISAPETPSAPFKVLRPQISTPRTVRPQQWQPRADSDRGKLYNALKELASETEPLATADLEPHVPSIPSESISKALSGMFKEGLLQRKQVAEQARNGANIEVFKYWVPAPSTTP